ncbi:MAG TPA: hypothetical protein VNE40_01900 [Candidatus Dormibacteraeota bacterium]|nr:hypothetical protein [Candidatus Dormibacteraeota bacterium]
MNPQLDKPNNFNLPPPAVDERINTPNSLEQGVTSQPEVSLGAPESRLPGSTTLLAPPVFPTLPPSLGVPTTTQNDNPIQPAKPVADSPVLADDADLIEKEWVNKAKDIVNKTKEDPHLQTKEITILKTDYLKKRYNKSLKMSG